MATSTRETVLALADDVAALTRRLEHLRGALIEDPKTYLAKM